MVQTISTTRNLSSPIENAHWASLVPVKPLAKITLEPADFPFLDNIRPYNPQQVKERAEKNPNGFPRVED